MDVLEPYQQDFILCVELGFVAVSQSDEDAALKLFQAAELMNAESLLPQIGRGYMYLLKLQLKKACEIFEEILAKEPSNDLARALLGLSVAFTVREVSRGEKILQDVVHNTIDDGVKAMGRTALEFIEKYIKKSPTPAEAHLLRKEPVQEGSNA